MGSEGYKTWGRGVLKKKNPKNEYRIKYENKYIEKEYEKHAILWINHLTCLMFCLHFWLYPHCLMITLLWRHFLYREQKGNSISPLAWLAKYFLASVFVMIIYVQFTHSHRYTYTYCLLYSYRCVPYKHLYLLVKHTHTKQDKQQ